MEAYTQTTMFVIPAKLNLAIKILALEGSCWWRDCGTAVMCCGEAEAVAMGKREARYQKTGNSGIISFYELPPTFCFLKL